MVQLKKVMWCMVLLYRVKKEFKREDGSYIRFDDNAVVLLDENDNPKGTRVMGSCSSRTS